MVVDNSRADDWPVRFIENRYGDYRVDVVIPYPSDVIFHPVVTDSAQIPSETRKIESLFLFGYEGFGIMAPFYKYTPLVIGEHRIGPAVVIDAPTDGGDWGLEAITAMAKHYRTGVFPWNRSHKDFRVAVPIINYREGSFNSLGFVEEPFSAIGFYEEWISEGHISTVHQRNVEFDGPPEGKGWSLLHEMGHNLSLGHLHDDTRYYGRDPNYPAYPDQNINVDGYWVDADGRVVTLPRDDYVDFMAYENAPEWISAYHYRKMAEYAFGIEPTLEARRPVVVR